MMTNLIAALAASDQTGFFDGVLYTDPELLSFERSHIFRHSWLYVGHIRELLQSHNVCVIDVAETSILIVRDSDHALNAFYNVCPHRAASFCAQSGSYQLKHLVCPYHAWVYNLQGELVGVPQEQRFSTDFCRNDYPLVALRVEQWQGFVFVNFDQTAPTLHSWLGRIPQELSGHCTAATQRLLSQDYPVQCNWKVYHDNTLCDYHVAIAHRTTLNPVQGPVQLYEYAFDQYVNLLYTPTTEEWRSQNPVLENLSDRARHGFFTFGLFPNLHLLALPNGILGWLRIDPITVDTCMVHLELFGIPKLSPPLDSLLADFEAFMAEDIAITETVQRGYASGAYRSGPINQLEDRIRHQQQLIRQCLQAAYRRDRASAIEEKTSILN